MRGIISLSFEMITIGFLLILFWDCDWSEFVVDKLVIESWFSSSSEESCWFDVVVEEERWWAKVAKISSASNPSE